MKKIKIFSLLLIVILLTGCSGNYDITINKDLTVDERAEITVDINGDESDLIDIINEKFGINNYKLEEISNNVTKITYNKKYDSIEEYLTTSVIYNEVVDRKRYNNNRKTIYLETNTKELENNSDYLNIDNVKVSIVSPLKIVSHNADEVINNNYIWNVTNNNAKSIIFEYSLTKSKVNVFSLVFSISLILLLILTVVFYEKFKKKNYF